MDELLKTPEGLIRTGEFSAVNPDSLSGSGKQQAQAFASTQPITSQSLSGDTQPVDLTSTNDAFNEGQNKSSRVASGVSGAVEAKITTAGDEIDKLLSQQESSAKEERSTANKNLLQKLGLQTDALEERITAQQDPEFLAKQKASNDARSALQQSRQAKTNELEVLSKQVMSPQQRSVEINAINNRFALQDANLAVAFDVANRDYQSAIDNINTVAQLKIDAAQPFVDYYQNALNSANIQWSKSEQNILNQKISQFETSQQEARDIASAYQTLLTNNPGAVTPGLANQLKGAKNISEFNDILARNGVSFADPLDRQIKQAQLANLRDTGGGAPTVKSINGVDMQWNPTTGQWETVGGGVADAGFQQLAQTKSKIDQLTELSSDSGLGVSVGTSFVSRSPRGFFGNVGALLSVVGAPSAVVGSVKKLTGTQQNFIASVAQLKDQLNLDKLIESKAQGATFGALSDNELRVLASASTRLGTWEQKDSDGNVVGYNTSEANFKKEIDKINNFAKLDYILKGGNPDDVGVVGQEDGTLWTRNSDGSYTQIK